MATSKNIKFSLFSVFRLKKNIVFANHTENIIASAHRPISLECLCGVLLSLSIILWVPDSIPSHILEILPR